SAASPSLTIELFGPMRVLTSGHPFPRVRSRQSLWLLAVLALRYPRAVEREWLAGMLWPDSEQSRGFSNLRVGLSELRAALGAESWRLKSPSRQTLCLDTADAFVDACAFDAAIASGDGAELRLAVDLYRGPLLEGCNEEWVFQERETRESTCVNALL